MKKSRALNVGSALVVLALATALLIVTGDPSLSLLVLGFSLLVAFGILYNLSMLRKVSDKNSRQFRTYLNQVLAGFVGGFVLYVLSTLGGIYEEFGAASFEFGINLPVAVLFCLFMIAIGAIFFVLFNPESRK